MSDDRILLHTCCAPCSTVVVPWWRAEGLEPDALFVNPNIQPDIEYGRRLEAMKDFANRTDLLLIADEGPSADEWVRAVGLGGAVVRASLSDESDRRAERRLQSSLAGEDQAKLPSLHERCRDCLVLRLRETAWSAAERGIARFSTSLTVSPYQQHDQIVQAGLRAADEAGVEFLYADLRRHYRRSVDESRRQGLYRQKYCGCVASKWDAWLERAARRRRRRAA